VKKMPVDKLIESARKAPRPQAGESIAAPFGFAARVAARWCENGRPFSVLDLYERLGWWGAGLSSAICLLTLVLRSDLNEPNPFDPFLGVDSTATQAF
jgi:hypothetical protein